MFWEINRIINGNIFWFLLIHSLPFELDLEYDTLYIRMGKTS